MEALKFLGAAGIAGLAVLVEDLPTLDGSVLEDMIRQVPLVILFLWYMDRRDKRFAEALGNLADRVKGVPE